MSEWQPIETAPYDRVLIWCPFSSGGGAAFIAQKDEDGNWIDPDAPGIVCCANDASHWMPLPEPPNE